MLRKIITAAVAALMLATVAVPALACPKGDAATGGQFKTLNREINALRSQLNQERAKENQLYAKIRDARKLAQVDRDKLAAYRAELAPLAAQLKTLRKQLEEAVEAKDQAKQTELKTAITDTIAKINAVKTKYADIVSALKNKRKTVCDAKLLKEQVEPKYTELKALVAKAETVNADIKKLMADYKAAVKAGDTAKQTELVNQLIAKKTELKDNLTARLALRTEITKLLNECVIKIK